MKDVFDLAGKNILIVGASSGIGRQTALTLSALGARLTLAARTEEKLQKAVSGLEGTGHDYLVMDVTDPDTIAFLLSSASDYITGITLPVDGGITTC